VVAADAASVFGPERRASTTKSQIYYLIKSYCEGGAGCYYSASNRAGTARLYRVGADRREDSGQVLRANDDTRRFARDSLGGRRRVARCRRSSASLRNFPIDSLKIDGSFICQLKDHRLAARLWSRSGRPLMDSTKPQPRAFRRKDG
jgi:hypothetical protein